MSQLITIVFWLQLLGISVKSLQITWGTYPRIEIHKIGWDVFALISNAFFAAWSWYLLWGVY